MSVTAAISQAIQDATGYAPGTWAAFLVGAMFVTVLAVSAWIVSAIYGAWANDKIEYHQMVRSFITLAIVVTMILTIVSV